MGKGENADYKHFLLFPQNFPKTSPPRSLNFRTVWQKLKRILLSKDLTLLILHFSFSNNVFNSLYFGLYKINPFPKKPWFLRVCSTSLLKTQWEKEKLLVMSNFCFSHSVFYPFGELSAIFNNFKIVVCKAFEFGRV